MRRWLRVLVLFVTLVGLAGCRVTGRVEVLTEHEVFLDVIVTADRIPQCSSDLAGLTADPTRDGYRITACRYTGRVDPGDFAWAVAVVPAGEYLAAWLQLGDEDQWGEPSGANSIESLDVTVTMPGTVIEASTGVISGNEVRLTDPSDPRQLANLRIVSLNHGGPAHWVWWLGAGLVLGAGGVLALTLLRRAKQDQAVPAGDPGAEASPADQPETGAAETAGSVPDPEEPADDPTAWARPPGEAGGPGPAGPDPARWAPERNDGSPSSPAT